MQRALSGVQPCRRPPARRVLAAHRHRQRTAEWCSVAGRKLTAPCLVRRVRAAAPRRARPADARPSTIRQTPAAPLRWVNEWNNLDGTIERGYAGRSIFFENDTCPRRPVARRRVRRLLASLGINGCSINNVNADTRVITPEFVPQLARLAEAFRPWGVRLAIVDRLQQPAEDRRARHVRSARRPRRRVLEDDASIASTRRCPTSAASC